MVLELIEWMKENDIGDFAGVAGVAISIGGFVATLIGVYKSKRASVQAAEAANDARRAIETFDTLVDFSAAITALEEIKRMHRLGDSWPLLPDRYALTRKLLIQLRGSNVLLSDDQKSVVQNALVNLVDIEKQVERALNDPKSLKPAKFNSILSDDIDGLMAVLTQLKTQQNGGSS